ncbi:MAG: lipocalin family protein [Emcibacteraceae bacterium]
MKNLCLLLGALGLSACASGQSKFSKLETVPKVDLQKYVGEWHEIARIDHWFQKGCVDSKATYSLREDGDIDVLNECRLGPKNGKIKKATGRAWIVDSDTNAKLKVQFFLKSLKLSFLAGDYWIIALDNNYQYAMIGEERRKYLWILSREKNLPKTTLNDLVARAKREGFPTHKLLFDGERE